MSININDFARELKAVIEWTDSIIHSFDFSQESYGLVFRTMNPLINNVPLYKIDEYDTAT